MRVFTLIVCFAVVYSDTIDVSEDRENPPWSNISSINAMVNEMNDTGSSWINITAEVSPVTKNQTSNVGFSRSNKSPENLQKEKMKKLRIETAKLQLLTQMGMERPPPPMTKPSPSSNEIIQILLQEDEGEKRRRLERPTAMGERLAIPARNNGIKCSRFDESNCKIFNFEINLAQNMSSASLQIYKTERGSSNTFSIAVSYSKEGKWKYVPFETLKCGWNKIDLPRIFLPQLWSGDFLVEVRGLSVEDHGDRRPFLIVTKLTHSLSRQRRDLICDSNESCCMKPLRVSIAEIGFTWIIYPLHLELNMCIGKCMLDYSRMNTHYERALIAILENNPSLQESLGACWTLCCKPKQMKAVRVIYNDTDGRVHDQYIKELAVKSCSCS